MTDRFDVVTVGIEYEGRIVVRMVMWAQARRAIVLAARRYGGAIKRVNASAILGRDGDVDRSIEAAFAADPKIRLAVDAEAGGRGVIFGLRNFHHQDIAERRQRFFVERFGSLVVGDRKSGVIEHRALLIFIAGRQSPCGSRRDWAWRR